MATCFGPTFNHHQALKKSVQVPKCVLYGIPYSSQNFLKQYIN